MKFALMVDLGRTSPEKSTEQALEETTELVKMADQGGFDLVVCGEHHGHEMTIAPNPLSLLAYWALQTEKIRLGTGVVCAPFWHPVRLAGEAGLIDVISQGRLDLGIGRGAYPYEFARMANGISPEEARESVTELIPALRGLWAGGYEHSGKSWTFPSTTSTPRPVQPGGPPLWVSARHPDMFSVACENKCHVMVNPLDMPFAEVESLRERLDNAVEAAGNGWDPLMMVLRQTCVHDGSDPYMPVKYQNERMKIFRSLFDTDGHVVDGFVQPIDGEITRDFDQVAENYMFGSPDQVIAKLKRYESVGTDVFLYGASWGLPHELERSSLELFIKEIIPVFQERAG